MHLKREKEGAWRAFSVLLRFFTENCITYGSFSFSPHSCYWDVSNINLALLGPMLLLETIQRASSCLYMVFIWICDYFFIEKSNFIKNVIQPRAAIMKMACCECSSCLQYRIIDEILDIHLNANRNRVIALEILDCEKSTLFKHKYWTWANNKEQ